MFLTEKKWRATYNDDKKIVLTQLKIKNPILAFSVPDHHLCSF